jgi:hypothetical protein
VTPPVRQVRAAAQPGELSSPASPTDIELWEAICAQQPGALSALYDRHRNRVFGVCVRVLGMGPDAEEILEDTFVDRGIPFAWPFAFSRFRAEMNAPKLDDYEPART